MRRPKWEQNGHNEESGGDLFRIDSARSGSLGVSDLLADGPQPVKFCKQHITSAGISTRTAEYAAKELGVLFE
jgi:hypothetical protein